MLSWHVNHTPPGGWTRGGGVREAPLLGCLCLWGLGPALEGTTLKGCPLCPCEVGLINVQGWPRPLMRQAQGRKGRAPCWGNAPGGEVWAGRGKECGGRKEAGAGPPPLFPSESPHLQPGLGPRLRPQEALLGSPSAGRRGLPHHPPSSFLLSAPFRLPSLIKGLERRAKCLKFCDCASSLLPRLC